MILLQPPKILIKHSEHRDIEDIYLEPIRREDQFQIV